MWLNLFVFCLFYLKAIIIFSTILAYNDFLILIMLNLDKPLLLADAINTKILYDDLHYYVSAIPLYVFEFILKKWSTVAQLVEG